MKKENFVLMVLLSFLGLISVVSADVGEGCNMYGMMAGSYGFGGMFFGWIFGILVVVALILLIFWLIKQVQKK